MKTQYAKYIWKKSILSNDLEYNKCIERYIISYENKDAGALHKLKEECDVKNIIPFDINNYEVKNYKIITRYNKIIYGDFSITLPKERLDLLLTKSNKSNLVKMLINYYPTYGQQWALARHYYLRLHVKYTIDLECFASPINQRLMKEGIPYCSLYKEDKPFGSLGNIFDVDLSKFKSLVANPPFIENLLLRFVLYIHNWLKLGKKQIIFIVPEWEDSDFYKLLVTSDFLIYNRKDNGKNMLEVTIGDRVKLIDAKFGIRVIMLRSQ